MLEFKRLLDGLGITKPDGYDELGSGDRHGGEELTWVKTGKTDELTRFITVAMTPLGSKHIVEVWIGAEKRGWFTHSLIARYDDVDISLRDKPPLKNLKDMVQAAIKSANLLTGDDLTEKRIVTLATKKREGIGEVEEKPPDKTNAQKR